MSENRRCIAMGRRPPLLHLRGSANVRPLRVGSIPHNRPSRKAPSKLPGSAANHDTAQQVDGQPIRTRGDHPMRLKCHSTAPCPSTIH